MSFLFRAAVSSMRYATIRYDMLRYDMMGWEGMGRGGWRSGCAAGLVLVPVC